MIVGADPLDSFVRKEKILMKTAIALVGGLALPLGTALAAQQTQPTGTTPAATDQAPAQDVLTTPADPAAGATATDPAALPPADPATADTKATEGDPAATPEATTKDKKKRKK